MFCEEIPGLCFLSYEFLLLSETRWRRPRLFINCQEIDTSKSLFLV